VTVLRRAKGELAIKTRLGRFTLKHLTPGACEALQHLGNGGATEPQLEALVLERDGADALASFCYLVCQLSRRGLLWRSAVDQTGKRLAASVPIGPSCTYSGRAISVERAYTLSRFVYTRAEAGRMVVESPLAHCRLLLYDWRAAALLQVLAMPARVHESINRIPGLSVDAATVLMNLLLNAAMINEVDDAGIPRLDHPSSLQCWEFHDLLFHTRSREGRHDSPIGGTCRFAGKLAPQPALKPVFTNEFVPLDRPDIKRLRREDPPFAKVLEQRRSLRDYGDKPITREQLGEFLFRVARAENLRRSKVQTAIGPVEIEITSRPYPSGGALYELELYLVVNACRGLTSGLYHYDPRCHRLGRVAGRTAELTRLLDGAATATGIDTKDLQVLVLLTARFQRVAWKYSSIAYALILKNVGALYQSMYLAATAMKLAPCAVGCGNADLFSRAAGTDYYAETSVGEFLLGSLAPGSIRPATRMKNHE